MGLYVRCYGFSDTTRTVSDAVSQAAGSRLRMVTLDDPVALAVEAQRARRPGLTTLIRTAWVVLVLGILAGGAALTGLLDHWQHAASVQLAAARGPAVGQVETERGLLLASSVLTVLAVTAGPVIAFFALRRRRAAARARAAIERTVTDESLVDITAARLAHTNGRIFARPLRAIGVPTALWPRAVAAFAPVSDVLVIDVSAPGAAGLVRMVQPFFRDRWVLVGSRARLATGLGELDRLLDGERVLAYGPTEADRRRFTRVLRRELRQAGRAS
jgi:hypothetical protein